MTFDYAINKLNDKFRTLSNKAKSIKESDPLKSKTLEEASNYKQLMFWIMDYQELKDKDIAVKPLKTNKISSNIAVLCPRCEEYIQLIMNDKNHLQKFCSNCGQRLNWSEVIKNE